MNPEPISVDQLLAIIGELTVELRMLRMRLMVAENKDGAIKGREIPSSKDENRQESSPSF